MKKRAPKQDDMGQTEVAFKLLHEVVEKHKMEPSLWVGACLSSIAQAFIDSELSYEDFKTELLCAVKHYKKWWE